MGYRLPRVVCRKLRLHLILMPTVFCMYTPKTKQPENRKSIRIEASSGFSEDEIKKMKQEAEANAEADKQAKEKVDKLNAGRQSHFPD
jgi:molecular chaperone DnaK (HSP70)